MLGLKVSTSWFFSGFHHRRLFSLTVVLIIYNYITAKTIITWQQEDIKPDIILMYVQLFPI